MYSKNSASFFLPLYKSALSTTDRNRLYLGFFILLAGSKLEAFPFRFSLVKIVLLSHTHFLFSRSFSLPFMTMHPPLNYQLLAFPPPPSQPAPPPSRNPPHTHLPRDVPTFPYQPKIHHPHLPRDVLSLFPHSSVFLGTPPAPSWNYFISCTAYHIIKHTPGYTVSWISRVRVGPILGRFVP